MRRFLVASFSFLAGVAMLLVSVFVLVWVAVRIELIEQPFLHAAAVLGAVLLGIPLLVGITYLATHLVVRLYRQDTPPPQP